LKTLEVPKFNFNFDIHFVYIYNTYSVQTHW